MSNNDSNLYFNPKTGLTYSSGGDIVNCTVSVCPIELSVYGYRPSIPFSATLIALYSICIVVQLYLGIKFRKYGFMAAMILGCITEILGYTGRILYYQNPWGEVGFIMQIVLISIGPVFFAAAIYILISQIVVYISRAHARFNPRLFYWIFIVSDVVSLTLQAVGGAMSATSDGASQSGVDIALAGLVFQVTTLVFFSTAVVDYAIRSRSVWRKVKLPGRFVNFCAFLTLATLLILIRCCYRVYELSKGYNQDSKALRDEPMFIGLEGVMIIVAAWTLVLAHPGFVFQVGQTLVQDAQSEKRVDATSPGPEST